MGLPYFAAVWVWNYYADMLEKLKIDKPFSTYDEFIEHCVKAKKDGVSRYPILWVAGVGLEQLPGTWYQMTWNKRRHLLRQAGQPSARRRLDRARDPEVVGQHLREGPRHRRSRIAQGAVHDLGQGRSAPARTSIADRTTTTASTSPTIRRSRRSPARSRSSAFPATARRSASPMSISCRRRRATRNGAGSCCSISAARPRTATTRRPSASPRMPCWARATTR